MNGRTNEPERIPAGVHPEATLLPWYANETLGEEDRRLVARHLESCFDCRRELSEWTDLRRNIHEAYASQPEPSPSLAKTVLTKVALDTGHSAREAGRGGSGLASLDRWFRSLFDVPWVPSLATALLAVQFGLLLWVTMPPEREPVSTRSIDSPAARFTVRFHDHATEAQIREAVERVHGRIVDGPTTGGSYLLEVKAVDPAMSRRILDMLRAQDRVVSRAEAVVP
ncbi:MAG: zf-HC2 domain-containing protein [Nitrospira sp.]|nr:zf-HC2 domain-containing protein [Nitrospira sp.]